MRNLQMFLCERRGITESKKSNKPLTPKEKDLLGKANVFIMDFEVDGGYLPPEVEKVSNIQRKLKPSEARVLIDFLYRNAPGNY